MTVIADRGAGGFPAVFLDRDGVLNEVEVRDGVPHPPASLADMRLLAGVDLACRRLSDLGFKLVVVTNQPDVARGSRTLAEVEQMNDYLRGLLPLDDVVVCPHDDKDDCPCRKPLPGMLLDAARRLSLDLSRSFCVGDRWRDVEAGQRAGVRQSIFIDRNYGERKPSGNHVAVADLTEAVSHIESQGSTPPGSRIVQRRPADD